MKLEQQVCSLEIAKKLKDLGMKQESLFWWGSGIDGAEILKRDSDFNLGAYPLKYNGSWKGVFSAFTVAELGEMLPQTIKIKKVKYQLFVSVAMDKQWFVVYANENDYEDNAPFPFMMCHSEADARGKMMIYLLENKLIEVPITH